MNLRGVSCGFGHLDSLSYGYMLISCSFKLFIYYLYYLELNGGNIDVFLEHTIYTRCYDHKFWSSHELDGMC